MTTNRAFLEHFRCPDEFASFEIGGELSAGEGFFRFGEDVICYGQFAGGAPSTQISSSLADAAEGVSVRGGHLRLPFDLSQVADNLRHERYNLNSIHSVQKVTEGASLRKLYYFVRPILPVPVRKHLQRARLRGWQRIPFPHWPVDFSVESLFERTMTLVLRSRPGERVPFIWYWPNGAQSCALMTHDVEAIAGRNFCVGLMDLDDSFGIKSAFQVVPEVRYEASNGFIEAFRARGFEINIHDLNHDGALFQDRREFLRRAERINQYGKEFRTRGFRAGAMYRNQEWYGALDFSYDMSVPNVAHLEPQRGGCCTVMPYFIGNVLELPLTTTQDYSLFHILQDYSIELWKEQVKLISARNGLISFITHPDYLIEQRAREVYKNLLEHLRALSSEGNMWLTLPRYVDRWWRNRNQMKLIRDGNGWRIEGLDRERARVAYASLDGDRLVYSIETKSQSN